MCFGIVIEFVTCSNVITASKRSSLLPWRFLNYLNFAVVCLILKINETTNVATAAVLIMVSRGTSGPKEDIKMQFGSRSRDGEPSRARLFKGKTAIYMGWEHCWVLARRGTVDS